MTKNMSNFMTNTPRLMLRKLRKSVFNRSRLSCVGHGCLLGAGNLIKSLHGQRNLLVSSKLLSQRKMVFNGCIERERKTAVNKLCNMYTIGTVSVNQSQRRFQRFR